MNKTKDFPYKFRQNCMILREKFEFRGNFSLKILYEYGPAILIPLFTKWQAYRD
jgi:hypothetical protein